MSSRMIAMAALVAGTALFCLPVHAQMGATGGGMTSGGASGTVNSQGNTQGTATTTTQGNLQGNMGAPQGTMQARMGKQANRGGRMMRGDGAERQMTECLNRAATQGQDYGACGR
jgi:hypothetical protein